MTKTVCFYDSFPDELTKKINKFRKDVEVTSVQFSSAIAETQQILHFAWVGYEGTTPEWVKQMKREREKEY